MESWVLNNELAIRLLSFAIVFAVVALWEVSAPRRQLSLLRSVRWLNNLGLVALNNLIVRILAPVLPVALAIYAQDMNWGLFNNLTLNIWLTVFISVAVLDFIIYLQHVLVHAIPNLWRIHRVHHADLDYDLTTGIRFHPIEILFSLIIKLAAISVLGPPVIAVIIFEVVLNGMSMFNHGNILLPKLLDKSLRLFVVTPDMHRVHHSIDEREANSNFGFNLSIWDRLFGTYRAQPKLGHETMVLGIHNHRDPKQVSWLLGMLTLPFIGKITTYAINRGGWMKNSDQ